MLSEKEGDIENARLYYEIGDLMASNDLGVLYGNSGDVENAKLCFEIADRTGDLEATHNLALLHEKQEDIVMEDLLDTLEACIETLEDLEIRYTFLPSIIKAMKEFSSDIFKVHPLKK